MTLGANVRKILIVAIPTSVVAFCAWGWLMMAGLGTWPPSNYELRKTVASAKPVIAAIRAYEVDHKKPPKVLEDLVPKYLRTLPQPQGPAEGNWQFWSSENESRGVPEGQDWALAIKVKGTKGFLQFGDYFAFHPNGEYEETYYGGVLLRRVEGWGYYRE